MLCLVWKELWMTNEVYLISWNLKGAHSGGSSMGCYSHIALCVTCKSNWEGFLCEDPKCNYAPLVSLVMNVYLLNKMKYACPL